MRDSQEKFNEAVAYYKEKIGDGKDKTFFLTFPENNKQAFFSIAPFSRAIHELGGTLYVTSTSATNDSLDALYDVWDTFEELQSGAMSEKTEALQTFIDKTKPKIPTFEALFQKADFAFEATEEGFVGHTEMDFQTEWLVEHRAEELAETSRILWRDVYAIKDDEHVGIGFPLIMTDDMLGHPMQDYLDAYQIIWAMQTTCPGSKTIGSSSTKDSMLVAGEPISDLRTTLLGCELDKEVDEEPFTAFKPLSELLNLKRIKPADASFFISGKGYPGKHLFGDAIGYPSLNKKTRWKSPGQMIYKFDFVPQTKYEERDPLSRVAFTETLPIDIFIETNLVDWDDIRARNQKIKDILDKCDEVFVKSNIEGEYVTDLKVTLVKPDGGRRWVKRSDTDVTQKINQDYLEMTGIRAGCMGNIPGGEAFVTPEKIEGIFVGDVVIAIDQSYPLSAEDPFVVKTKGNDYEILTAPEQTLKKFNEKKDEAWQLLMEAEKNGSLPQEIIDMKKRNFNNIGEFAINTNPKAKLCDYLIVNEKIAKMMHIALGSGYEEDRSTDYHIDIVFDAPRQKLDVYGTDADGNEHWILKQGEFISS